jgi:hypothetical protein
MSVEPDGSKYTLRVPSREHSATFATAARR